MQGLRIKSLKNNRINVISTNITESSNAKEPTNYTNRNPLPFVNNNKSHRQCITLCNNIEI